MVVFIGLSADAPGGNATIHVQMPRRTAPEFGRLTFHQFTSKILRNTRTIRVWVPPGFRGRSDRRRYSVLYLNDGQNLFEASTSFSGTSWNAGEVMGRLIAEDRITPQILVGIDHAGERRAAEYLPFPDEVSGGRAAGNQYLRFLTSELMPFIDTAYPTRTGPEHTSFGGSSLGAVIVLHAAITRPGWFGRVLLESPSLFVGDRGLLAAARGVLDWPQRIALGVGARETQRDAVNVRIVRDVRALAEIVRRAGLGRDRLKVTVDRSGMHSEESWAARLPSALSFLFARDCSNPQSPSYSAFRSPH